MALATLGPIAAAARSWLVDQAAPLWWDLGRDPSGGYVERIGLDGRPIRETRRVRVSARQVYAFSVAARVGWPGPVDEAVRVGLDFLRGPGAGPNGGIAARIAVDGSIVDAGPDLYDQAFWMLALAEAQTTLGDPMIETEALAVLDLIERDLGHPVIGFEERKPRRLPLRANPHMHLLEVANAWIPIGGSPRWEALGRTVVAMCRRHFRDPETGVLLEFFDADWRPVGGEEGDVVEPGHLFEWAWLLWRFQTLVGEDVAEIGLHFACVAAEAGVDARRGVAVDEIGRDFRVRRGTARTWPQTERLKAGVARLAWTTDPDDRGKALDEIVAAWSSILGYLDVPIGGLWRDRMNESGEFVQEPAPASTFYHLACAVHELQAGVG